MFHGVLALLTRSLRQDARELRNHVFRLVFVTFIYLALLVATVTSGSFGAPGLHFFQGIAWLNFAFIACAGIGFFASSITEEKEEETLGLLTMAGLNPLGILLGKSTSRLIQASMLLIVQFPFMLLSVTLGGVTPHQIMAAYVALLAFLTLMANAALIWSTACERTGSAAGLTFLMLVAYVMAPYVAPHFSAELTRRGVSANSFGGQFAFVALEWIGDASVGRRLEAIMGTGFQDPIFSRQVISNFVGGIFCFLLAWAIFIPCTKDAAGSLASRGLVLKTNHRLRFLSPGRVWPMPLAWKDFQFTAGGFGYVLVKLAFCCLLASGLTYFQQYLNNNWTPEPMDVNRMFTTSMTFLIMVESSVLAARIFYDELRLQTLSTLLVLPRSIPYIGYTKALGCILGLVPSFACLAVGAVLLPGDSGQEALLLLKPGLWGLVLLMAIFLHLVTLLSLFVKWGALPLALAVMLPFSTCCPVLPLLIVASNPASSQDISSTLAAIVTVWILISLFCFVFQMMIAARLQEIGSK